MTLEAIASASQINNAISFSERLNVHLNDEVRLSQTITLEQRFSQIEEQFASATDAERHRMLADLNAQLDHQEYYSSTMILDPPESNGRRTFGRGGTRRLTAAEIAEKELRRNDRNVPRAPQAAMATNPFTSTSEIPVIDLTTPMSSPQRPRGPVFMSFSSSGALIRSSIVSPIRSSNINTIRSSIVGPIRSSNISTIRSPNASLLCTQREESDIVVLEVCRAEEGLAETNRSSENAQQKPISTSSSTVELLPETSLSRPRRQVSRHSIYEGSLIQPRKRKKC
jgi:hypothetical protein